ncbi:hypothetical protein ACLB2K_039406 [Fragaria x ananassa]
MSPHPPLHPWFGQGSEASELVISTKSKSIKSSELVIDQVLHHFTPALPQGSATETESLVLPLRSDDVGEALHGHSPGKKTARMKDLY